MHNEEARSRVQTICLMILTTAAIGYAIYWLRPVLLPFVIAVFVVSGIAPVLETLQRRLGVDRLVAAGITFLAGLVIVMILGWTLWTSTIELREMAPAYRMRIQEIVNTIQDYIPERFIKEDLPKDKTSKLGTNEKGDLTNDETSTLDTNERIELFLDSMMRHGISQLSGALLNLMMTSIVVLIYVFFLLLGATAPLGVTGTWHEIDLQIRNYLRLKTVISVITGAIFGLAIALFGLPMAMTFGLLAFLLNYIPNIGPLVATVLPIPLIILQPDAGIGWMATAILVLSGIQFASGNIIEPKMMGESTDLHPVVVLLALMFWGMMWGIVGMFLATPITAGIKIVLERIDATKPIAAILAGHWKPPAETSPKQVV
ncbi:AI-2E family transporter [Rubinisphaera italica]|uniref:AI-2 transport protein TqsA n=1 Tax=Rubinisphaera italica TaxID=2527969 RepID=A0A5C5XG79_9PLAN|nr:AI-2E family transporter [Rubinisphaera italica]TWT61401.1 AI-2 transport protein TqsA [Rubinisphaera italica]